MTVKPFRIGTRDSVLATWQARHIAEILEAAGHRVELHFVKTEGDRVLDTPLPLMGGKGVFTKALDDALLAHDIDLAVHSLKDIPTNLPDGLVIGAVSKREDTADVLVARQTAVAADQKGKEHRRRLDQGSISGLVPSFLSNRESVAVIASSSNRRIGQWLARYPRHRMTDIRGNIQTRLKKLVDSDWDGAIFAAAGLKRLTLDHYITQTLDWMLPAPAQGAMGVMIRKDAHDVLEAILPAHDPDTALCTAIERDVLHQLQGGCSAPVGALAEIDGKMVHLLVNTVYPDGSGMIRFEMSETRANAGDLGKRAAEEALRRGADTLIRDLAKWNQKS